MEQKSTEPQQSQNLFAAITVRFQLNNRALEDSSSFIFKLLQERQINFNILTVETIGQIIEITGSIQQITETVALIQELIVLAPTEEDLSQLENTNEQHNDVVVLFDVPDSYIGGLIGKNGSGIQLIRRFARCRVYLEPQKVEDLYRQLRLCGHPRNVFNTINRILYRILFLRPSLGNIPSSYPDIETFVQSVLGKQAAYQPYPMGNSMEVASSQLSSLSSNLFSSSLLTTGPSWNSASQPRSPLQHSRPTAPLGNEIDIFASARLNSSIATLSQMSTTSTIELSNKQAGYLIGKGGETIKKIRKSANCHVKVEEVENEPDLRYMALSGNVLQVTLAERLIIDIIQDSFM